jgi:hypothetical protein
MAVALNSSIELFGAPGREAGRPGGRADVSPSNALLGLQPAFCTVAATKIGRNLISIITAAVAYLSAFRVGRRRADSAGEFGWANGSERGRAFWHWPTRCCGLVLFHGFHFSCRGRRAAAAAQSSPRIAPRRQSLAFEKFKLHAECKILRSRE